MCAFACRKIVRLRRLKMMRRLRRKRRLRRLRRKRRLARLGRLRRSSRVLDIYIPDSRRASRSRVTRRAGLLG